jgi:hypothetical protein
MNKLALAVSFMAVHLIIVLFLVLEDGSEINLATFLNILSFLTLSAIFTVICLSEKLRPVSFMLILFWCYGLAMPAIYQTSTNNFPWYKNSVLYDTITPASFLLILSISFFTLGFFHKEYDSIRIDRNNKETDISMSVASLFVLGMAGTYSIYAINQIGLETFTSTRESVSVAFNQASLGLSSVGLIRTLPGGLAIGAFLISAYEIFIIKNRNVISVFTFIMATILLSLMNFPISIPRYLMVAISFIILCVALRKFHSDHKFLIYASSPLIIFIIFPFLGTFNRYQSLNLDFFIPPLSESLTHGDFDGFQSLMNVMILVREEGFAWGGRMISAFLFFIPRSFWTAKHDTTGADAAQSAGYDFLNISMPLPGEIYSDFGFIGVAIGMFFFGKFIAFFDHKVESNNTELINIELAMIGIVLAGFMPIIFRGALLGIIASPASVMFLIFIWGVLRRLRL